MRKRSWILASTGILLACLLIQNVSAAASSVGFPQGSIFVWRWTRTTFNADGSVNATAINYKMMNVTSIVVGTDHLNISAKYPTANQTDYEANGVTGSTWSGSSPYNRQVLDANKSYWFQGFYCKTGVTMLELLSLSGNDTYAAFATMHAMLVQELTGYSLAMVFAAFFYPSTYWSTTSASISLALISYAKGTIDVAFGYMDSGHWTNTTVKITSSFTYSAFNMVLSSMDSTLESTQVSWNGTAYESDTAKVQNQYKAVYPSDLANYIAIEWLIGGGVGVLLIVVVAAAVHKNKKK